MPFITQQFTNSNIRQFKFIQRIHLKPEDLSLNFLAAREVGSDYRVDFLVQLNPKQAIQDPSKMLTNSDIDMASLRNAIISKLVPIDKKYMLLKNFSTIKAEFHFDSNLWLKDTLNNVEPRTTLTTFSKIFKFKIPLPPMILRDAIRIGFPQFLIRKFKKYLDSQPKVNKWFNHLFPQGIKSITVRLPERFEYIYDYQANSITLKLKTFWIMALVYAIGEFSKIAKERKIEKKLENPGKFFETKVKQQIPNFDVPDLKNFLSKKFL
jgi:hypothetical protein